MDIMKLVTLVEFSIPIIMLCIARATIDARKIQNGVYIGKLEHFKRAVIQFSVIGLVSYYVNYEFFIGGDVKSFIVLLSYYCSLFWLVFDMMLNKLRGLDWNYLPEPKEYTAFTDRMLSKIRGYEIYLKVAYLLIGIITWIVISKSLLFTY